MAVLIFLAPAFGRAQAPAQPQPRQILPPSLPSTDELTDLSDEGTVPTVAGDTIDGVLQTVEQTGVDLPDPAPEPPAAAAPTTPAGGGSGANPAPDPAPAAPGTPAAPAAGTGTPTSSDRPNATPRPGGGDDPTRPGGADAGEDRERAERRGTVEAGPAQTATDTRGGFLQVFAELPWTLLFAAVALALLGLIMTGRSAGLAVRSKRLRRQGQELREDVGALQTALLPTIPEQLGEVRVAVAYEAATGPAAGGDFHDVLRLDDDRVAVIVGDVCGHGREALTITALVHYTVRAYLEAGLEPRDALRLADQAIGEKLGSDFATAVAAIYDCSTGTLRYSCAGHPAPVLVGAKGDHAVVAMTPPPIGVGPRTGSRQTDIAVPKGTSICFVTDGLLEARTADRELLGREGLVGLLEQLPSPLSAQAVLDRVEAEAAPADDLTACVLQPLSAGGSGEVVEEVDLDSDDLTDSNRLAAFLNECGVDPGELAPIAKAAGGHRAGARLRVRRVPGGTSGWKVLPRERTGNRDLLGPADRFGPGSQGTRGDRGGASASDHRAHRAGNGTAVGRAARA